MRTRGNKELQNAKEFICQECGGAISNDFGVSLSFCTNCGSALNNFSANKTVEFGKETFDGGSKPKNKLFTGLILGALSAAFLIGGGYFFHTFYLQKGGLTSVPRIGLPRINWVSASDISQVTFSKWRHVGLLYSGDGFVESQTITFERGGNAKRALLKNYDDGKRTDEVTEYKAVITGAQFEKLTQTLVENDFFSQENSKLSISEQNTSLTVKHSGGEKQIKTAAASIDDTWEIKAILEVFTNLQNQTNWKKAG